MYVHDELTHLCTFPGSDKHTPEVYQSLSPTQLYTTRCTKRKKSTDIELIEGEQTMSQTKQTSSETESTNDSDHEQRKNSGKPKKAKYQWRIKRLNSKLNFNVFVSWVQKPTYLENILIFICLRRFCSICIMYVIVMTRIVIALIVLEVLWLLYRLFQDCVAIASRGVGFASWWLTVGKNGNQYIQ